ncbi:MAG: HD-GYP domain-containing protein [Actinomycetota bacterium]|nr:HD-GYP domain-containing protein [Actinomycetota bacterium]
MARQPTRVIAVAQLSVLGAAAVGAILLAGTASWRLDLLLALAGCAIAGDLAAASTAAAKLKVSGSFFALVLATVLLGGPPAALIGVATILVGWLRWREDVHYLRQNLVAYAVFPLVCGLAFHLVREAAGIVRTDGLFYVLVFATFVLALALNFALTAGYQCWLERSSLTAKARQVLVPLLPSELYNAVFLVLISFVYVKVGLVAIALVVIVLAGFQHLLRELLVSQDRANQLASLQLGMMSALLHTLDARDRMTARHSAAVARYSREIARAAGLSEREQELVHTAGLLHDLGKFIFPDRILKAEAPLAPDEWRLVRCHPYQGAKIVSQVEGYGPVADIVLAHHERVDGAGYPRGLGGEEIPALARILSVADVYDVMTARDSYRRPVSSTEAIDELREVAGTQLDERFVEIFARLLEGRDVRFRHGVDADFDAELALERRVHAYAAGGH